MKASFVDLRKKSADIIRALQRNESITVFYRGKPAARMEPIHEGERAKRKAAEHEAFGLWADREDTEDVTQQVRKLREGRFNAL